MIPDDPEDERTQSQPIVDQKMAGQRIRGTFLIPTCALAAIIFCIYESILVIRPIGLRNLLHNSLLNKDLRLASQAAGKLAWYQPDDVELIFQRADLANRLGDQAKAAELLSEVPEGSPRAASARFSSGMILRELYRVGASELAFEDALRADQQMVEARRALVGLMGIERREAAQINQLWGWYKSGVMAVEPLRLLAQSVVVIPPGTLAKTIDEGMVLERAMEAEPDNPHTRPALARFYRNRGEVEKALRILNDWLKRHEGDLAAQIERLFCLVEAGDVELAQKLISSAPDSWRESANFWVASGDHFRNEGDWQNACQFYEKASLRNDRLPEIYYRMAECKRALGLSLESAQILEKHDRIRQLAEKAAAVDPKNPDVTGMMDVARLCRSLSRNQESVAWALEVLKLDRKHAEARAIVDQVKP